MSLEVKSIYGTYLRNFLVILLVFAKNAGRFRWACHRLCDSYIYSNLIAALVYEFAVNVGSVQGHKFTICMHDIKF